MNRRHFLKLIGIPFTLLGLSIPTILKPKSKRTKVVITRYNEKTRKLEFKKEYAIPGTVAELKQNDKIDIDTTYGHNYRKYE